MTDTYYALQVAGKLRFICVWERQKYFELKIKEAFWNWKGMRSVNTVNDMEGFMCNKRKVKVTVEVLK